MRGVGDVLRSLAGSGGPACRHLGQAQNVDPRTDGCEECEVMGAPFVHRRLCLACGHVGCCDQSPNRHARAHFEATGHPIVRSHEPGETWAWCWIDEVEL